MNVLAMTGTTASMAQRRLTWLTTYRQLGQAGAIGKARRNLSIRKGVATRSAIINVRKNSISATTFQRDEPPPTEQPVKNCVIVDTALT
jgi:hypothetical protein